MPPDIDAYVGQVVVELRGAVGDEAVVGVAVHGSLALGGFVSSVSDIDVLAIVDPRVRLPSHALQGVGRRLCGLDVPARGLEFSVVDVGAALRPGPPWPFLLHVTTDPAERKVVVGDEHPGDPDLLMHYVVARHAGISVVGPPPSELIGEVDRKMVLRYLADELAWAQANAGEAYGVLNAGRALRYLSDGTIVSKLDGAVTAIAAGAPPHVVERAINIQRGQRSDQPPSPDALAFMTKARLAIIAAAS
jgi:Domain of unknown function (DUF4111)